MGGKAAILLVLAFSTLFLMFGHRFNSLSTDTVDNVSEYFAHTQAYNIAVSAANIAANKIFIDKNWADNGNYQNIQFNGGDYTLSTVRRSLIPTAGDTILTLPNGYVVQNPDNDKLAVILAQSRYHINGVTPITNAMPDRDIIENEVIIILRPSSFAKYGNYYAQMTAFPATGDVFSGPFHVQGTLRTYGSPVFTGKVTMLNGLSVRNAPPPPVFMDGYNTGVDIPPSFDTTGMRIGATIGGKVFTDTTNSNQRTEVRLEFIADGNVKYQQKIGSGSWSPEKTVPISTLTPNGMIFIERGNAFVKGTLNGRVTVAVSKLGNSGSGNIFQTDDIKYSYRDDPDTYPIADDMLGLVAEENIRIVYNSDTRHNDIYTQASMYAKNGKVGPDWRLIRNDGRLAKWKIFGGIAAHDVQATANYRWQRINGQWIFAPYRGYKFVHEYNTKVQRYVPPFFPDTKKWEVVTWLERKVMKPGQ